MMMPCLIVCHVCQAIISYVLSAACQKNGDIKADTPWQINMEHQNGGLEDDFLFIWVISSSMLIFRGVQCKGGKIMFHGTVDNQVVNLKFLDDLGTGEPDSLQHDTRLKHDQVYLVSCFRNLHDLLFVFPLGSLTMEFSA